MDGFSIFPPEASRQGVRIEYTKGKIDVRETSRGRHRDEVRALVLMSVEFSLSRCARARGSVGRCFSVRETIDNSKFTGTPI